MPRSEYNAPQNPESVGLGLAQLSSACPNPLTPPPELQDHHAPVRLRAEQVVRINGVPSSNNTAAGMAQSQEDSIYMSPVASPQVLQDGYYNEEKDKMDLTRDDCIDDAKPPVAVNTYETAQNEISPSLSFVSTMQTPLRDAANTNDPLRCEDEERGKTRTKPEITNKEAQTTLREGKASRIQGEAHAQGLAPIDLLLNRSSSTKPSTFSERRLIPDYPSHVFQSMSRYSGTQQSDRQVYNVDVTILTVDMAQCTMTGYLLIRGLTPEHDTLQTYFTGEIIGGPSRFGNQNQKYTFRTANPAWGAGEKTDLMHWARFPAWRSLHPHAKRDIDFPYPIDGGNWWQQENIFMRWKEHFLVPDHKTKSIAGASFEGFYYICLNQVQGRISGIYYHSKSEKFQQLELNHEGQPDIFNHGITPCVEFR